MSTNASCLKHNSRRSDVQESADACGRALDAVANGCAWELTMTAAGEGRTSPFVGGLRGC